MLTPLARGGWRQPWRLWEAAGPCCRWGSVSGPVASRLPPARQPVWAKPVWAQGTTDISRGGRGLLVAEARGLSGIRVLGRERSCFVCWSRSLAQQREHCNLLVPIVQMGRLRPQEAPTQEAGSPFTQWGWGMWNV